MHGIVPPAPHMFLWCGAKWSTWAEPLLQYSCCVYQQLLGFLEPHQWHTWPSAYNLLHRLDDTELLQLTVWLALQLIRGQVHTPSRSISHPLICVSKGLPTGSDVIACHAEKMKLRYSYLQHSYYNSDTVTVQIRISGTVCYVCGVLVHSKYVMLQVK